MPKFPTSFRLSELTIKRLQWLAKRFETSMASEIERLVREEFETQKRWTAPKREAERLSIRATKKEKK